MLNNKLLLWSITVACAGFLFGFDTAVISGADQPIQALWQTSDLTHGLFIMSSALWGTVLGALGANIPCDRLGRKTTLIAIGVLYLLSALGSALATDPVTFSVMRFIGGIGVGVSSIAVPAYIAEIAPAANRGRLVALYQFQIVFGILIAFLSNYLLADTFLLSWRWMLGIEALPAAIYLLLVFFVPESPRWLLLHKQDHQAASQILHAVGEPSPQHLITQIESEHQQRASENLFSHAYRWPILLAFLLAFFNQLSGINFVIYFAPRIFSLAGLDSSAALLSSAGIGLVNLLFTVLGMVLIDKAGRKTLLVIGSIGYILSLAALTIAFQLSLAGNLVVAFIFMFIASHAVGQGAVIWVFISEIFPNSVRTKGQSLGCGTHWVLAALITLVMPAVLGSFTPTVIFGFFTVMMVLQLICVLWLFPETRGKSIEELGMSLSDSR